MAMNRGGSSKTLAIVEAKVVHNYNDYACKEIRESMENDNPVHAPGPGGDPPFPVKLHHALMELKMDGKESIVGWQPHGRCFIVRNPKLFAEQVLPLYFRQTKFQSFQRQLNLYGFKRLTQGPDKGGYYHELFLRGMSKLAARIIRTTIKNKGPRKAASPKTEPNLYSYPTLPGISNGLAEQTHQDLQTPVVCKAVKEPTPVATLVSPGTPFTKTASLPRALALSGLPVGPTIGRAVVSPREASLCLPNTSRLSLSGTASAVSLREMSSLIAHSELARLIQLPQLPPRPSGNFQVATATSLLGASAATICPTVASAVLGLSNPWFLTDKNSAQSSRLA
ncbi:Heat stress transcription factor [Seminavis robusta]|uniref:Heat stress transcription factor n=1 Tax=Seminavis robusta TaxID=568900 RepID=A0A9N8H8L0_9STRA|nr:Heat stress transcription factor [Seminavis robusta]|eukprot:Sro244_g097190.1 Heat stress transcription factor (338) ;mRNA; r:41786-43088